MGYIRLRIISGALLIIIIVNIYGALPGLYYAPYRGIGPDWIAVYEDNGEDRSLAVSVQKFDARGNLSDTGRMVQVTIRNTYRDSRINLVARITLGVLAIGCIAYYSKK